MCSNDLLQRCNLQITLTVEKEEKPWQRRARHCEAQRWFAFKKAERQCTKRIGSPFNRPSNEQNNVKISQVKPNQAKLSQAKKNQAKQSHTNAWFPFELFAIYSRIPYGQWFSFWIYVRELGGKRDRDEQQIATESNLIIELHCK